MPKEPLFPHVPRRREPLFPHIPTAKPVVPPVIPEVTREPWQMTKVEFRGTGITAENLIALPNREEIQAELQKVFGSYEDLEKMDGGELPYTIEGDVGLDYMADIEYAAVRRDLAETKGLLEGAYSEIYDMYKKGAALAKALSETSKIREGSLSDKFRASTGARGIQVNEKALIPKAEAGMPEVAGPPQSIVTKWAEKKKNIALLKKDIEGLRETYSLEDVNDAIAEYEDISREDYEDREEYQEEKDAAWDKIMDAIDNAEELVT